jgi:hypothetical protein
VGALVAAAGPDDRGVEVVDGPGEGASGIALVAEQDFAAAALAAREQRQRDRSLVGLGRGELKGAWGAVGSEDRVQAKAPEIAAVTRTPAVVGGVAERGATDRLAALGAGHRGAVDEQQSVLRARALTGEDAQQPLQRDGQPAPTLEVPGPLRQPGKQMPQALAGDRQEAPIRRDPHDRLGHAQRDDLGVCDAPRGVVLPLRQEIVGRDEHGREQQVEVGVHRGPLGSAMLISTADFDPAATKSSTNTAPAAESTI